MDFGVDEAIVSSIFHAFMMDLHKLAIRDDYKQFAEDIEDPSVESGLTRSIARVITELNCNRHHEGDYAQIIARTMSMLQQSVPHEKAFLSRLLRGGAENCARNPLSFFTFCGFLLEMMYNLNKSPQQILISELVLLSSSIFQEKFDWKTKYDLRHLDACARRYIESLSWNVIVTDPLERLPYVMYPYYGLL